MAWNRFPDFTCPVDIAFELFLRSRRPFHAVWLKRHDGSESTGGKLQQKIRRPQAVAGTAATVLCNWCAMRNLLSRRKKKAWGAKLRARCQHSDLAFICKETTAGGQQVKRAIPRSSRRTVKTEGRVSTQRHTDDVGYCLLWVSGRFRLAILGRRKRSLQDRSIFANVKRQIPSKLLNALSFILRLQVASSTL